jgi:anti-sigma regulatory factor (Ser/Thr protein kinase)
MLIKKMPARMESLHDLLTFITDEAKKKRFSEDARHRIELVVEEALVNVFVHGHTQHQEQVEVRCLDSDDSSLTVEIIDTGVSFNPLSLADPDLQPDLDARKIGGMGVFLIRKMTDGVAYRREGDNNILTMTVLNR